MASTQERRAKRRRESSQHFSPLHHFRCRRIESFVSPNQEKRTTKSNLLGLESPPPPPLKKEKENRRRLPPPPRITSPSPRASSASSPDSASSSSTPLYVLLNQLPHFPSFSYQFEYFCLVKLYTFSSVQC